MKCIVRPIPPCASCSKTKSEVPRRHEKRRGDRMSVVELHEHNCIEYIHDYLLYTMYIHVCPQYMYMYIQNSLAPLLNENWPCFLMINQYCVLMTLTDKYTRTLFFINLFVLFVQKWQPSAHRHTQFTGSRHPMAYTRKYT